MVSLEQPEIDSDIAPDQVATPGSAPAPDADRITFRASDGGMHSIPKDQLGAAKQVDPNLKWIPNANDPLVHIQTSDGQHLHVHADDVQEAQKRDPKLVVHGSVNGQTNSQTIGQAKANDPYAKYGGSLASASPASTSSTAASASPARQDPYAKYGGSLAFQQQGTPNLAAKPGAYQQRAGAPIQNANADNQILHDEKGNWTGQYLMKRDDETDSQFIARAIEAGKHVTPQMLQQEHEHNKKNAPLTLATAAVAGPAMLGAEALGAAPFVASSTPALAVTGEATGEMIVGPSLARQALTKAAQLAAAHPKAAKALGLGAVWVAAKVADQLGVPLPKVLKLLVEGGPPVE